MPIEPGVVGRATSGNVRELTKQPTCENLKNSKIK